MIDIGDAIGAVVGAIGAIITNEARTHRPLRKLQEEFMTRRECALMHSNLERRMDDNYNAIERRIDESHRTLEKKIDETRSDMKNGMRELRELSEGQSKTIIELILRNGKGNGKP